MDHYNSPTTIEELRQRLARALEVEPDLLQSETLFVEDLGARSINAILVCLALEEWYDVCIPDEGVWQLINLATVVEYLKANRVNLEEQS